MIGVQWLVSSPAQVAFIDDVGLTISSAAGLNSSLITSNASLEVLDSFNSSSHQPLLLAEAPDGLLVAYATCNVTFHSEMLGMLYVVFLVLVVVFLAFKVKKQQNFRMIYAIQSSVSPYCITTSMYTGPWCEGELP